MSSAFDAWWAFCQRPENDGQPLHDTSGDPGGWTSYGITLRTYQAWHHGVALSDLKEMTPQDASIIAELKYWKAAKCDKMLGALGIVVCDTAWLSGPGTAIEWLQQALVITSDGVFGPMTQRACDAILSSGAAMQCEHLTDVKNTNYTTMNPDFAHGWIRRSNDCLQTALNWNRGNPI